VSQFEKGFLPGALSRGLSDAYMLADMPKGPQGQRRPADVIGNAVKIARIATGEDDDAVPDDGKNAAAQEQGRKGGAARAKSLSPERRAEIAKKAAEKRWQAPKPEE
jgi:hypothetical protein